MAVNDALLVANLRRKTAIDWERRPTLFTLFPGNKFIRTKMRLKEGTTIESQREICLILFTSDVVWKKNSDADRQTNKYHRIGKLVKASFKIFESCTFYFQSNNMLRLFNFEFAYCTFFSHFNFGISKASSTVSGVKKWQSLKIEGREFSNLFFNRLSKLNNKRKQTKGKNSYPCASRHVGVRSQL